MPFISTQAEQILAKHHTGSVSKIFLDDQQQVSGLLIDHQTCQATISLLGGQLLTWQPNNSRPVFWLSEKAIYQPNKAIRGGVPICWPWFGSYQDGGNHGFARQAQWQVDDINISAEQVELTLSFNGEQCHRLWPTPFILQQTFIFKHSLQQQLQMTNRSAKPVLYSGALHNYFRVSGPQNVDIPTLANKPFDDKLTSGTGLRHTDVQCIGPVDRIYHTAETMQIIDKSWRRTIELTSEHCQQWVLWNPGIEQSQQIADIHAQGEQQFICLEAANTQWQTIPAHQSRIIGQVIKIIEYN